MSVQAVQIVEEEPPTRAQRIVGKVCQYFLFALCVGPIALFPVGLAYKLLTEYFP